MTDKTGHGYDQYPSVVPSREPTPPRAERPPGILPEPVAIEKHTGIPMRGPGHAATGIADRLRPETLDQLRRRGGG
jgi:hypothetical protein